MSGTLTRMLLHVKWPVVAATGLGCVYCSFDASSTTFLVGSLLAAAAAKVLKRIFQGQRPQGAERFGKSAHAHEGFPSSHALTMAFMVTYLHALPGTPWWLRWLALTVSAMAVLARVDTLHTPAQVTAGALMGAGLALAWFALVQGALPRVTDA